MTMPAVVGAFRDDLPAIFPAFGSRGLEKARQAFRRRPDDAKVIFDFGAD